MKLKYELNDDGESYSVVKCAKALTTVEIPAKYKGKSVTKIARSAFKDCDKLECIVLLDGLEYIGIEAFESCGSLKSIVFPKTVAIIDEAAFAGCNKLENIIFNYGIREIRRYAFLCCNPISIEIPSSVKKIGQGAFSFRRSISENKKISIIKIPEGIEEIDKNAFDFLNSGDIVFLPQSIKKIGRKAFGSAVIFYFGKKSEIILPENETDYNNLNIHCEINDNNLFITKEGSYYIIRENTATLAYYSTGDESCAQLPAEIIFNDKAYPLTVISCGAFVSFIKNVVIPESVKIIENGAFSGGLYSNCTSGCRNLLILGKDTRIDKDAICNCKIIHSFTQDYLSQRRNFKGINYYCTNDSFLYQDGMYFVIKNGQAILTSYGGNAKDLVIPSSILIKEVEYKVSDIGECAFYRTELKSVVLPKTVSVLGRKAFYSSGVEYIKLPFNIKRIEAETFKYSNNLIRADLDGIEHIGKEAFSYCEALETITFDSIKEIGEEAFANCEKLVSLTFPSSLTLVLRRAFYGCRAIKSLSIPEIKIESEAFSGCYQTKFFYKAAHTTAAKYQMYGKAQYFGVTESDLKTTVEGFEYLIYDIGAVITGYNGNQSDITIPELVEGKISVIEIGSYAFEKTNIKSVIIPCSIKTIKQYAFFDSGLVSVQLNNGLEKIERHAFWKCNLSRLDIPDTVIEIESGALNCIGLMNLILPSSVVKFGGNLNPSTILYCRAVTEPPEWETNWNVTDWDVWPDDMNKGSSTPCSWTKTVWGYKDKLKNSNDIN